MRLPLLACSRNNRIEPFGTGILDTYPSNGMAISTRQLDASSVNCMQVLRDSDNTYTNIGFAYNSTYGGYWIDTVALLAFVGAGNGYVRTWYDQSGNGRDAAMTNSSYMPQIVASGAVLTQNGKPTVQFDGTDDYMTLSTGISASLSDMHIHTVCRSATTTANKGVICFWSKIAGGAQNVARFSFHADTTTVNAFELAVANRSATTLQLCDAGATHDQVLGQWSALCQYVISDSYIYKNGVNTGYSVAPAAALTTDGDPYQAYMGYRVANGTYFEGQISELLVYQSSTYWGTALMNAQKGAFGL